MKDLYRTVLNIKSESLILMLKNNVLMLIRLILIFQNQCLLICRIKIKKLEKIGVD